MVLAHDTPSMDMAPNAVCTVDSLRMAVPMVASTGTPRATLPAAGT